MKPRETTLPADAQGEDAGGRCPFLRAHTEARSAYALSAPLPYARLKGAPQRGDWKNFPRLGCVAAQRLKDLNRQRGHSPRARRDSGAIGVSPWPASWPAGGCCGLHGGSGGTPPSQTDRVATESLFSAPPSATAGWFLRWDAAVWRTGFRFSARVRGCWLPRAQGFRAGDSITEASAIRLRGLQRGGFSRMSLKFCGEGDCCGF